MIRTLLLATILTACSSPVTSTPPSTVSTPPTDGTYLAPTAGDGTYALQLSAGHFRFTSYNAAGEAIVKTGSYDLADDGTASVIYLTSTCTPSSDGDAPWTGTWSTAGDGFTLDENGMSGTYMPGSVPTDLTSGCYVNGRFMRD